MRNKDLQKYEDKPFSKQLEIFADYNRQHAGKAAVFLLEHGLAKPVDICQMEVSEYHQSSKSALPLKRWKQIEDSLNAALKTGKLSDPEGKIQDLVKSIHEKRYPPGY